MTIARYLTHPQVSIDPAVPVPRWSLSDIGRSRAHALVAARWMRSIQRIISSDEAKAIETAEIIANAMELRVEIHSGMGENDRSATGYLPPAEFEIVADQFFAIPDESVRGWTPARDEQRRIVAAVTAALHDNNRSSNVLFVGHGAVGALNLCHLLGSPITRLLDQPPTGGGNVYAWDAVTGAVLHRWSSIEDEVRNVA